MMLNGEIWAAFVSGENGFQKCFSVNAGVWLLMENTFSRNAFQFDRVLCVKSFPFLFYLQISFSGKQRERERESESESEIALVCKERERERKKRKPIAGDHEPSTSPTT